MLTDNHKTTLLLALGTGMILSDFIPTPSDGLYFYRQRINKQKLEKKEITPKQYWVKDAVNYYGLNTIWWGLVLGSTFAFGKSYIQKRNILISLVAGGAVFGVLYKNIKKDEEFYKTPKSE